MNSLNQEYSKLAKAYPHFIEAFNKLKEENKILNEKIKEMKDKSELYENKKPEDFYDTIIKINSILDLAQGWDISMMEKGKKNYEQYKNEPIIKMGVIGNENKGKSKLLSKISDMDIPAGFSIKTEGLSILYPELKLHPNLKIIFLDSAGLETPVLDFNKESINAQEEEFIEKARDKLLTEVFLQNYIIKNSDVLLLVFGKLTFEEQKLLEKVKRDMKNLKRKESLIVVHNLKEFERIKQVEEYINEILLKSSTFKLEKTILINKEKSQTNCNYFFYEPNTDPKIFHLIFAREGTEAGDYFNSGAINFIINKTNEITDKKSFDILNSVKDNFCSVSENILEEPLKSEDLIIENEQKIKLKNTGKKIKLKRCLIDEIGFSYFYSDLYEPKYEYYIVEDSDDNNFETLENINSITPENKNKKLVINVEIPGDYKDTAIKKSRNNSYTFINIKGTKVDDNYEKHLGKIDTKNYSFTNREYGDFNINIKLPNNIELDSSKPEIKKDKGIISFIYKIKPEDDDISF